MKLSLLRIVVLGCMAVTLLEATALAENDNTNTNTNTDPPAGKQPGVEKPRFDITIQEGVLLDRGAKVAASIENIVVVMRSGNRNLNIVLTPGVGDVIIRDLKMRSSDLNGVMEAITIASGGAVRASRLSDDTWAIMASDPRDVPPPDVEVFNLSGYLQGFAKEDEKKAALDQLQLVIVDTLTMLARQNPKLDETHPPSFRFHPGASLFIVVGSREAIDVTRKVVTALPGYASGHEKPPSKAF